MGQNNMHDNMYRKQKRQKTQKNQLNSVQRQKGLADTPKLQDLL